MQPLSPLLPSASVNLFQKKNNKKTLEGCRPSRYLGPKGLQLHSCGQFLPLQKLLLLSSGLGLCCETPQKDIGSSNNDRF